FDALNRPATKSHASFPAVTYNYDLMSRQTSIAQAAGGTTIGYAYDSAGRRGCAVQGGTVSSSTQSAGVLTCTASAGRVVHYRYDAAGNRTRVTWPDAFFVTYNFDDANRMSTVVENDTLTLATYTYDTLARRKNVSRSNGHGSAYVYEPDSDL